MGEREGGKEEERGGREGGRERGGDGEWERKGIHSHDRMPTVRSARWYGQSST